MSQITFQDIRFLYNTLYQIKLFNKKDGGKYNIMELGICISRRFHTPHSLSSLTLVERHNYDSLMYDLDQGAEFNLNDKVWESSEYDIFNESELTELDWAYININNLKIQNLCISLLDKYSDNQEENWNIKFILWAKQVCLTFLKQDNLVNLTDLDSLSSLLNPNFLDYFDLIGILPKFFREEYLEYYKDKKYDSILELLNRLISIWYIEIETLNYDLINNSKNLYLLILDISVLKLKAKQINLLQFYLLLSSNPLSKEIINQIKGLDSFLLNIELDGKDQDSGIIFDSNRWDFIYHWIKQIRDCVIKG